MTVITENGQRRRMGDLRAVGAMKEKHKMNGGMALVAVMTAGLFLLCAGGGGFAAGYAALTLAQSASLPGAAAWKLAAAWTLAAAAGLAGGYGGAKLTFPVAQAVAGVTGGAIRWIKTVDKEGWIKGTKTFCRDVRDFTQKWKEARSQGIDIFSDIPPERQLEYNRKLKEEFSASGKPAAPAAAPQPGAKPAQPRNQMTP